MYWNDNRDDNVVSIANAKPARSKKSDALIKQGYELEEERRERSLHFAMEKERKARELAFYDDLDAILEHVRELADMAEFGAGEAAVDSVVQEIVRRIDRLPPPREDKLRLNLGRNGLAKSEPSANDPGDAGAL